MPPPVRRHYTQRGLLCASRTRASGYFRALKQPFEARIQTMGLSRPHTITILYSHFVFCLHFHSVCCCCCRGPQAVRSFSFNHFALTMATTARDPRDAETAEERRRERNWSQPCPAASLFPASSTFRGAVRAYFALGALPHLCIFFFI